MPGSRNIKNKQGKLEALIKYSEYDRDSEEIREKQR